MSRPPFIDAISPVLGPSSATTIVPKRGSSSASISVGSTARHIEKNGLPVGLEEPGPDIEAADVAGPIRKRRKNQWFEKGGPLRPFRLLRQDIRAIKQRYASDWTLFNQLIVASAVYVFFTNLLPGITFASDLYVLTGKAYGTIEVVLSTGLIGIIFSLLIDFLHLMAWALIHACWMHFLLAIFNAHDYTMQYVTTFSTEIFSLLNSIIYFHKAIQELERAHANTSFAAFLYAIIGAIGTLLVAIALSTAENWKPLFHRYIRMGLREYAAAISIILFIGMPHIGELASLDRENLPISPSFRPSSPDRDVFFVKFWQLPVNWVFLAIIPGFIITVLFFFDHEVSTIICTIDRYGTKKPGGFAWDIVLLGLTTALSGVLGIPPANGLIPQAPLHSESLLHTVEEESTINAGNGNKELIVREVQQVYEQRWSSFLHAGGILLFMSPPFMHLLGLTPTSVLAGLFLFMGEQSLVVNPILLRTFYLLTPPSELPKLPEGVPGYAGIHFYTLAQIVLTVIIFIVTLTVAAPAFPLIIISCVPIRLLLMKRLWKPATLRFVDSWACKVGTPEDDDDLKITPADHSQ
ncbi:MAG: hypothetical protein M1829_000182 [Trizodia sp. TS-e1964]|nr:MAG: hypothetical protein M1829_000182 [Trizodia sp. TS-e1964]